MNLEKVMRGLAGSCSLGLHSSLEKVNEKYLALMKTVFFIGRSVMEVLLAVGIPEMGLGVWDGVLVWNGERHVQRVLEV